ncbi:MAG: hydrogenase formation protein HypD [Bacteroidota bacterium]
MKFVDEYRNSGLAKEYLDRITRSVTRPWTLMEICGGQTHTIVKYGIDALLPPQITLIHGPGCPVCVTGMEMIDKAILLASRKEVIFTSFGDMVRVPGSSDDLLSAKARGGDIRIVYSPLDAVNIAARNPDRKVVFFAIGFETTAPANAMAVWEAKRRGLSNFSILCSHVLVPPAIEAILSSPENRVQGFLAAGHVCAVVGYEEYLPIAEKYRIPIVVTGFEPVDILQGIMMTVGQLERGEHRVENQYARSVRREGNTPARALLAKVFEITDRAWRGIGVIPRSGYKLRQEFSSFDAECIFDIQAVSRQESSRCVAGEILQGLRKPPECPAFARECNPEHPLGAPMVSSEGSCAAYYHYRRVASTA